MSYPLFLKTLLERYKKPTSWVDRLMIGILALGLILIIGLIAYLAWFTFTNRSVTYLLPAEKTIAYAELEDLSLPPKLKQETVLDLLGLSPMIKGLFGLEVKDIQTQLGQGRLGVALLDDGTPKNQPLLFIRTTQRGKALKFFQGMAAADEKLELKGDNNFPIYAYPKSQHFVFAFKGPYLFVTQKAETLGLIRATADKKELSLNADYIYRQSLENLPRQSWMRGYLNIQKLSFGADNTLGQTVAPLKTMLNHLALTVRKEYNGFHFNIMLAMKPEYLSLKKGFSDSTRFAYSLTDYLNSKKLAAYAGGANLGAEWQNTLASLSEINPSYGIILEGILRAQVSKVFGDEVSLADDLYPLFEGEYALSFENLDGGQLGLKLILKHTDKTFAEIKMKKMLAGFRLLAAQFTPKVKSFLLPDGTETKELVADSSRLKETTDDYQGYKIDCIDISDSPYGFCSAVTEDLIILANHIESVKETIDLLTSAQFALSQSQTFRKAISNLSAVSDETSFIDFTNTIPLLKDTKIGLIAGSLLEPFEAVTWVKHYFEDGVSTEGYLLLK